MSRSYKRGYSTIYVILVTMGLLLGFFSILSVLIQLKGRADAQRHMVLLSRNILASHDRYLMDSFALPAYDPSMVEGLIVKQLKGSRFDESAVTVTPTGNLSDYRILMDAMTVAVELHTITEFGVDAVNDYVDPEIIRGMAMLMNRILKLDDNLSLGGNTVKVNRGRPMRQGDISRSNSSVHRQMEDDEDDGGNQRARSLLDRFSTLKSTISRSSEGMVDAKVDVSGWKPMDTLILNQYIIGVFSDKVTCDAHELEFFQNKSRSLHNGGAEVEEIIAGIRPDAAKVVEDRILVMRWILNCAAIASDKSKMIRIEAEATLIPLPPPVTIGILVALEAAIQAESDVSRLMKGKGVPLPGLKSFTSKGKTVSKRIETLLFYYDDHLRLLLAFNGCGTNVNRMMQIMGDVYRKDTGKVFDPASLVMEHRIDFSLKGQGSLTMIDGYVHRFDESGEGGVNEGVE